MQNLQFSAGKRIIGGKSQCFIIAEIGVNHNNNLSIAKKLIDSASKAGCDAVKFQSFKIENLYSKNSGKLDWKDKDRKYSYDIYEANKSFQIPDDWLSKLKSYCKKKNIILLSSTFDKESVDDVEKLGIPLFKLGSTSLTNLPLLEYVAKKGKPIILSIGGANVKEIKEAVKTITKHNKRLAILHCHLKYPTPLEYVNMNVLKTLKKEFPNAIIGYSDHTENPYIASVAAIFLGAKIIEKHITLNKKMKGPDHFFALEPQELKLMVGKIREAEKKILSNKKMVIQEKILGSPRIQVYDIERYIRNFAYQTIISVRNIKKGERITENNVRILRPGKLERGIEPKYYYALTRKYKAKKEIQTGKSIKWEDVR